MDLRQLEIIRAIAETGSFTAAGHKLHVSQSAISRQILLLEDELKTPVFLRIGRRIRITPAGEALLQLSHRMFQDLTDTVAGIGDSQETLRGTIRILGGMTVCLYVFPTLLAELTRQHPGVEVKIINDSTERCIQHLRAGTGDLALLTLPIKDADMVTVPVLQEELLVVTAAKHPLSKKRKVSAADLAQQPFVLFESGSNTRRVIDEFFAAAKIEPRIVMETENVEIIKAMVRHGLGITIVSHQSVARDVASGHLYSARIDGRALIRETGWVYPKMSRTPRAVEEVVQAFDKVRPKLRLSPQTAIAGAAPAVAAGLAQHPSQDRHRLVDLRLAQGDEAEAHGARIGVGGEERRAGHEGDAGLDRLVEQRHRVETLGQPQPEEHAAAGRLPRGAGRQVRGEGRGHRVALARYRSRIVGTWRSRKPSFTTS